MIATSRRRNLAIIVGLLIGLALFWRWYTREPAPEWEFDCGGEMPVVAVSADGQFLAVGASTFGDPIMREIGVNPRFAHDGGLIQIWNLADRKMLASCETDAVIKSLAFTSDGLRILAAMNKWNPDTPKSWHGRLLTWRFRGGAKPVEVVLPDSVVSASLSADDKIVATILGADGEGPSKLCVVSLDSLLKGVLDRVTLPPAMAVDVVDQPAILLQDNHFVVRAAADKEDGTNTLEVWDIAKSRRDVIGGPGNGSHFDIAVSPDKNAMALATGSGPVIIDLKTKKWSHPLVKGGVTIRYRPNNTLVAIGGGWKSRFPGKIKGGFWLYKLPSWKLAGAVQFSGWDTAVRSLAFTPDGETLVTARDNGLIQLWSVKKIQTR